MKKTWAKKLLVTCGILVGVFLISWVAVGISISNEATWIIHSAYDTNGKRPKEMDNIISDRIYKRINYRDGGPPATEGTYNEVNKLSFVFATHNFFNATAHYRYTYDRSLKSTGEKLSGSCNIPCKIFFKFENGRWVVVGYYEPY